jgi:hypothetical protein
LSPETSELLPSLDRLGSIEGICEISEKSLSSCLFRILRKNKPALIGPTTRRFRSVRRKATLREHNKRPTDVGTLAMSSEHIRNFGSCQTMRIHAERPKDFICYRVTQ